MVKKSLEQQEQELTDKLKALKEKKTELAKQEKARNARKTALEKERLRKQDAHIKILLGGYVLSEMRKSKDTGLLVKAAASVTAEKDKKLLNDLAKTFI